jgi:hypothetical protein
MREVRGLACRCSIVVVVVVVVALLAAAAAEVRGQGAARSQSPQSPPAPPALPDAGWAGVVAQFAQALAGNDPGAVAPLLSDAANVRSMDGRTSDALRLLAGARGCVLVSARSYVHAPPSAAGDVAEAFRDASPGVVPGAAKERMIPVDEAELRRANATAARWLTESLNAAPGDRVAIVVLFSAAADAAAAAADATNADAAADPLAGVSFVLLKGTPAGTEAKVQTVVFGNPRLY